MEPAALFLLLLLPHPDATGETATAIERSLRAELGDVAMATVPDTLVTPAMLEGRYRARFVARVTWAGKDRATIEVVSSPSTPATAEYRASRVLTFSSQDRKAERGRAIGLVVAGLLRESPVAALSLGTASALSPPSPEHSRPGVVLGASFAMERANPGNWAMGTALHFDLRLLASLRLRVSGNALFGDQFADVGSAVDVRYSFLQSNNERHGVAVGLGVLVFHESASTSGEHGGSNSQWNLGFWGGLSAHTTLWKSLRVVGQVGLRASARAMTVSYGEEESRGTMTFSRWRPELGLGLAYVL
jgi:hypothetical protein